MMPLGLMRYKSALGTWHCSVPSMLDGDDPVTLVGFDDLAVAAEDEDPTGIRDDQHRLEAAQVLVGAPFLAKANGGANQVALVLVEVLFELVEKGQGVGHGTGEAADDLAVMQTAHFRGALLHDDVTDGHLTVPGDGHSPVALHRHDSRRVCGGHTSAVFGGRYLQAGYPEQLTKGP